MCGIVGMSGSSAQLSPVDRQIVRAMARTIVHRGPDDEGFYHDTETSIGMRRLSIIDLEAGQQPVYNTDRTVSAVCNGEIYNYRQLRKLLASRGHRCTSNSDTEVIPHLYDEFGLSFVEHLEGMFAIALWDSDRRRLVLIRDRLGVKPLYYRVANGKLAFASEIKALLELPDMRVEVDVEGLRDHLSIGYSVAPKTIFAGISKLPPATILTWERGQIGTKRFWEIPSNVVSDRTAEDWSGEVHRALRAAVDSHMVSDVPIGAFLSGGIDSSAVVALMSSLHNEPVNTYAIGYAGGAAAAYYNELPFAATVANVFQTNHHEILVQPRVAELLPKLIWHLEEPISDSAITTTFLVSQLAADSVKVILSGVGGDELFAGYNRYSGDHYSAIYRRIPAWLRTSVIERAATRLPSSRQSRWLDYSRYARRFVEAGALSWDRQYKYFVALQTASTLSALLTVDSTASEDGLDRVLSTEASEDPLLRLLRVDWQTQLAEDLLLLTDKMSMAVSIECRVPFLDHRLVELAATIPAHIKRPNNQMKALLKRALVAQLPEEILNRRKRGFGAPVGSWFKAELKPLRAALLAKATIESRGLLSWPTVEAICEQHDASQQDYTDLILVLMNLEIWSRIFVDKRSSEDVAGELVEHAAAA